MTVIELYCFQLVRLSSLQALRSCHTWPLGKTNFTLHVIKIVTEIFMYTWEHYLASEVPDKIVNYKLNTKKGSHICCRHFCFVQQIAYKNIKPYIFISIRGCSGTNSLLTLLCTVIHCASYTEGTHMYIDTVINGIRTKGTRILIYSN
jgi:hypothetical protein